MSNIVLHFLQKFIRIAYVKYYYYLYFTNEKTLFSLGKIQNYVCLIWKCMTEKVHKGYYTKLMEQKETQQWAFNFIVIYLIIWVQWILAEAYGV